MTNDKTNKTGIPFNNDFIMKPKVDFCFCELMADDEIRCGFISALLGVAPDEIETQLLPTHLRKEHKEDKLGILDVRVLLNGSVQIDIEIQIAPFKAWAERSLFYLCKMYTEQIHSGEDYPILQKCIHVGILDFSLLDGRKDYYSRFHLWEDTQRLLYTDKLEIHILELPKLAQYEQPQTELLHWAQFFNAESKETFEMIAKTNPYIKKAYDTLTNISADEQKRLEYEAREKAIRDHNYLMRSNWEDGVEEGMKKGAEANTLTLIRNLMETMNFSEEQAMAALKIPADEHEKYKLLLKKQISIDETDSFLNK